MADTDIEEAPPEEAAGDPADTAADDADGENAAAEAAPEGDANPDDGTSEEAAGEDGEAAAEGSDDIPADESFEDLAFDDEDEFDEVDDEVFAERKRKLILVAGSAGGTIAFLFLFMLALSFGGGDYSLRVSADLPPRSAALQGRAALTPGARGDGMNQTFDGPTGLTIPAVAATAFSGVPEIEKGEPLRPAPIRDMVEGGPNGLLPKVPPDGRMPWKVYARPFAGDSEKPKVAILINGVGMSQAAAIAAIEQLPPGVTLSFEPYTSELSEWVSLARTAGHEVTINLPMEPIDFPAIDPGPLGLFTDLDVKQREARLSTILGLATGYIGFVATHGSLFATTDEALKPVLEAIRTRGLAIIDPGLLSNSRVLPLSDAIGLPNARVDMHLDTVPSTEAIQEKLKQLEDMARAKGRAIAIAEPYPLTIRLLAEWSIGLPQKNLELAPVSALVKEPPVPETKASAEEG